MIFRRIPVRVNNPFIGAKKFITKRGRLLGVVPRRVIPLERNKERERKKERDPVFPLIIIAKRKTSSRYRRANHLTRAKNVKENYNIDKDSCCNEQTRKHTYSLLTRKHAYIPKRNTRTYLLIDTNENKYESNFLHCSTNTYLIFQSVLFRLSRTRVTRVFLIRFKSPSLSGTVGRPRVRFNDA